jgi:death on curing protein
MMISDTIWISEELAISIHGHQLALHGGLGGIRDEGLLSSAIARPRHLVAYVAPRPDLAALAASYAFGIAKNHPFLDGNKRTAQVVYRTFLLLNGVDIKATQDEKYSAMIQLADGTWSEEQFADWLRQNLRTA